MPTISKELEDIMGLADNMRKDMIKMGWQVPLPVQDLDEGFEVKLEKLTNPN